MSWKDFELECGRYLNNMFGENFEVQGASDSTVSDIYFKKGNKEFYIEAKENSSQCGQFVLLPDKKNKKFIFSPRNKTNENIYTKEIMEYMTSEFDTFYDAGTSGQDIKLDKEIFYNWIIDYYKTVKNVAFFITNSYDGGFIIFPIDKFPDYFDVTAKYREKKSGSRNLNEKHLEDFKNSLKNTGIEFEMIGLKMHSKDNVKDKKIEGDNYTYLIREDKNSELYKIKMLSNTRNANVIFSIELKESICLDDIKNDAEFFREFVK